VTRRVQFIMWRDWRGFGWHRWQGGISTILFGSLLLGWLEVRVWR
jgi:hypothetical protein